MGNPMIEYTETITKADEKIYFNVEGTNYKILQSNWESLNIPPTVNKLETITQALASERQVLGTAHKEGSKYSFHYEMSPNSLYLVFKESTKNPGWKEILSADYLKTL